MFNQKNKKITYMILSTLLLASSFSAVIANSTDKHVHHYFNCPEEKKCVTTDAGEINFNLIKALNKEQPLYVYIKESSQNTNTIVLSNGSRWYLSNFDSIKSWEKHNNLTITENHVFLSLYKYALVNLDLNTATPISLISPSTPDNKEILYIKGIDHLNNIIMLNNGQLFLVNKNDHGTLKKFHENNIVILGANTDESELSNPFLIIDASLNSNSYLRATTYVTPTATTYVTPVSKT